MCGLVGFASTARHLDKSTRKDVMFEGLAMDSFRGWDSTGIATVKAGEEKQAPMVYKRGLNGFDFIQLKTTLDILDKTEDMSLVLGHNRAATRGSVMDKNAHPFQFGHITLVHNGTITNTHDFVKYQECPIDVDSAKVAFAMARDGEFEILEKCEGAFAFMWHNSIDGTLNIARNERKPLFWAYVEKQNTMYWASEDTLLCHLLLRRGIDIDGQILYPEKNVHYKFDLSDLRAYKKFPFASSQGRHGKGTVRNVQYIPTSTIEKQIEEWEALHAESLEDSETDSQPLSTKEGKTGGSDTSEIDEIRGSLSHARLKDFRRAGVPTSTKKLERAKRELHKLGLAFEAPRAMKPESFIKYRNQNTLGIVLGRITKGGHMAQLHQITEAQYKAYHEYGRIYVKCVNTRAMGNNMVSIVVIEHEAHKRQYSAFKLAHSGEKSSQEIKSAPNTMERDYFGPGQQLITLERFKELAKGNCGHCDGFVNPAWHDRVVWIGNPPSPICHECVAQPGVLNSLGINPATDVPKPLKNGALH